MFFGMSFVSFSVLGDQVDEMKFSMRRASRPIPGGAPRFQRLNATWLYLGHYETLTPFIGKWGRWESNPQEVTLGGF
jgi:hypothetical protein